MRGIHRWPVNSSHKGPVTRKMFPLDDVIMIRIYTCCSSKYLTACGNRLRLDGVTFDSPNKWNTKVSSHESAKNPPTDASMKKTWLSCRLRINFTMVIFIQAFSQFSGLLYVVYIEDMLSNKICCLVSRDSGKQMRHVWISGHVLHIMKTPDHAADLFLIFWKAGYISVI